MWRCCALPRQWSRPARLPCLPALPVLTSWCRSARLLRRPRASARRALAPLRHCSRGSRQRRGWRQRLCRGPRKTRTASPERSSRASGRRKRLPSSSSTTGMATGFSTARRSATTPRRNSASTCPPRTSIASAGSCARAAARAWPSATSSCSRRRSALPARRSGAASNARCGWRGRPRRRRRPPSARLWLQSAGACSRRPARSS
mmetsp:Transcript_25723/g.81184  ORF Transcript_25723/g.81184 Transcript_25723/m.81184 type:complete len:204 (+) Transcript_25723:115-726(+)